MRSAAAVGRTGHVQADHEDPMCTYFLDDAGDVSTHERPREDDAGCPWQPTDGAHRLGDVPLAAMS